MVVNLIVGGTLSGVLYNKQMLYSLVLEIHAHHSKTLKDGWAKYIPNFALK
jgi:hypothetical protein